jgi:histone H1/5
MAPKAAATGTPKAAAPKKASPPEHPPYKEMIKEALLALKDRNGSSRPGLKKYIKANYKGTDGPQFDRLFNLALKKGEAAKDFSFPKGPSGTVKLVKKEPAAKAPAAKKPAAKKEAAAKKETTTKKPAAKKAAAKPKAAAAEKPAKEKKAAAKPKANAKKTRKEPAAAPAVVEKPTVLTKTKSGRVTKAPAPAAKKAAPKKKAAAAAPKKKATPKKKEAAPAASE